MEKVKQLTEILEKDLIASDFKWTLFVAASNSYKYDSLLKPFPLMFINNNQTLDIFKLREVIAKVPAFSIFVDELRRAAEQISFANMKIDEETVDLIYWCLLSNREPFLKSIDRLNVSIFPFFHMSKKNALLLLFDLKRCLLFIFFWVIGICVLCVFFHIRAKSIRTCAHNKCHSV